MRFGLREWEGMMRSEHGDDGLGDMFAVDLVLVWREGLQAYFWKFFNESQDMHLGTVFGGTDVNMACS
jgi:hypothetical protein